MKNKKSLIAVVALVLLIGATIAYFQSSASFENDFNAGIYDVYTYEAFESPDNWKPGEEIPKTIKTKNEGTIPAAVRMKLEGKWEDSEGNDITDQVDFDIAQLIFNEDAFDDWLPSNSFNDEYIYYLYPLMPGEETSSILSAVMLDPNLNDVVCTENGNTKTCESLNPVVGGKYTLTVTEETIQYDKYDKVWTTAPSLAKPESFATDSWKTISTAVRMQNTDKYHVGDEKELYIDGFGYRKVKIVNMSSPSECYRNDFSQTACGFVIAFDNYLNSYFDSNGWESSRVRAYLNSTKINNFDYQDSGFFNVLPDDLKSIIIDTKVVSGHCKDVQSNYVTTDKLYMLSPHEVFENNSDNPNDVLKSLDTSYNNTRQLDYYSENDFLSSINYNNYSTNYHFRSATANESSGFYLGMSMGYSVIRSLYYSNGVDAYPVFRIG